MAWLAIALVLIPLALHPVASLPLHPGGGWILGKKDESCADVCTAVKMECVESELSGVNSDHAMNKKAVSAHLEVQFNCTMRGYDEDTAKMREWETYLPLLDGSYCVYSSWNNQLSKCGSQAPDYSRFCFCEAGPSAYDDPKCVNMKGEQFDLYKTGIMPMVVIQNITGDPAKAILEVHAEIKKVDHKQCAQTFIHFVNITGTMVGQGIEVFTGPAGRPISRSSGQNDVVNSTQQDTLALRFGHVIINLRQRRHARFHVDYMNLQISGLRQTFGDRIGGLLGYDDHSQVARPSDECNMLKQKRHMHHQTTSFLPSISAPKMLSMSTAQ